MSDHEPSKDSGRSADSGESALPSGLLRPVLVATFGSLFRNLNTTSINVALNGLMAYFTAPLATAQWIVTGYLLALALVPPVFGWAVRPGSRRLYVSRLLPFTATSILCGGAVGPKTDPLSSIPRHRRRSADPARADTRRPARRPEENRRAISLMSIPVLVAPLLGPALAGAALSRLALFAGLVLDRNATSATRSVG